MRKKQQTSERKYPEAPAYTGQEKRRRQERNAPRFLTICLIILGAVCFLLPGVRFSGCLFLGMAGLLIVWRILQKYAKKSRVFRACKGIFLVCLILVFLILAALETAVIAESRENPTAEPVDAIVVLGAGVNGERPSLSLQTRIDKAEEYLVQHPEIVAVLSGGRGPGEDITEAEAMYRALTANGISKSRLILEENSTSTAENFSESKLLLEAHGVDTEAAVIGVVSNDFHMLRAKYIAGQEGLRTVSIPAKLPWLWLEVNYYVREAFAFVKTILFD